MNKLLSFYLLLIFSFCKSQITDPTFFGNTTDSKFSYFIKKNENNIYTLIKGTNESVSKPLTGVVLEVSCFDRKYKYKYIGIYGLDGKVNNSLKQPDDKFLNPYPGTVNEKLLKYACGESSAEINQFKITEVDVLPDLYIEMKDQARKIAQESIVPQLSLKSKENLTNPNLEKVKSQQKKSWIDYYEPKIETGDFGCSNIIPQYDTAIDNKLVVINKGNTDVVVKLIDVDTEKAIRIVFIKEGEQIAIKNIPQARYYLKEAYGKLWKQKNVDGKCIGEFAERPIYKKGKNIADFTIKKTVTSTHENYQIPSYSLEIGVTFSKKKSGNYISNTISSSEFNK